MPRMSAASGRFAVLSVLLSAPLLAQETLVAALPAPAPATLPAGKSSVRADLAGTALDLFTYKPASYRGERMILVLHGVLRNADEYRDDAVGLGDRFGALIVAPLFDAERFPSRKYQMGGVRQQDGSAAPAFERTYALIPKIAAKVREMEGKPTLPFWIVGHSAGGQFVMRMTAFQETGAVRHVAINPGSDLFPTRELPFGYGFGGLPAELSDDAAIQRYLAAPLTIFLGTADDKPDEYFDQSDHAMQQGNGRHQRGLACYWSARTLAATKGWPFGWQLVEAPGLEHDHLRMFDSPACEQALFGGQPVPQPAPKTASK
jgi:poly(3-hydroxybutyrate) depolymerase